MRGLTGPSSPPRQGISLPRPWGEVFRDRQVIVGMMLVAVEERDKIAVTGFGLGPLIVEHSRHSVGGGFLCQNPPRHQSAHRRRQHAFHVLDVMDLAHMASVDGIRANFQCHVNRRVYSLEVQLVRIVEAGLGHVPDAAVSETDTIGTGAVRQTDDAEEIPERVSSVGNDRRRGVRREERGVQMPQQKQGGDPHLAGFED